MGSDESKKLILARRARFMAAALAGVAATTTSLGAALEACGGETTQSPGDKDASPQPCLGATADPRPCLTAAPQDAGKLDAAKDAESKDAASDAEPQPCLAPAIDGG
jgi:hypothetical protein